MKETEEDPPPQNQRLGGAEWIKLRKNVITRDGKQCANCGAKENLEIHHVVPLSRGGTNKKSNLVTICDRCHNSAHEKQTINRENKSETERWLPTIDNIRHLIRSIRHPLKKAIATLLAKTGIGVGELCNVDMTDIYLPDSAVFGTHNVCKSNWVKDDLPLLRIRVPPREEQYSTRRERSETTIVPLDAEMHRLIKRWLTIRPDTVAHTEPLFLSTGDNWGERLSLPIVHRIVNEKSEEVQFVNEYTPSTTITPDNLRYFFAERFSGQPRIQESILGRRSLPGLSIKRVHKEYTKRTCHLR